MFDRLRAGMANALEILAARMTGDQRYPQASRIPYLQRTLAGVHITPDTAITISAVWACLRYLTQSVAVLPWHMMRDGKRGAEIALTHPLDYLLSRRVSDEWSSFQFRETLTHWALRYGNGYAEIEPDQAGRPYALWPIHPDRVQVCRAIEPGTDAYGDAIPTGAIFYEVIQSDFQSSSAAKIILSAKRVFHIRGFGDGPVGVNVIHCAAESLGWVKAVELFGASFFGNGANVAAIIVNKRPLSPAGIKRQKEQFDKLYKGPRNANKTAILDNDADIKTLGLDAEKSQLSITHQALISEVARWFGVPPHKIMDLSRGTFSNIEHQSIEVVVDTLAPWVKRWEDEADWKLCGSQNRQNFYTKMNMRGLLRGDAAARVAYYDGMVKIGAYSPNRVLEIEDENTIGPDGDIHVMQSQNVTLKQIAEGTATAKPGDTTPQDPKAPTEPAAPPETDTSQAYSVTPEILDLSAALGAQIQTQSIPVHV